MLGRLNLENKPASCERRYFTVEQANRSLVLMRRIVADVVTYYARLVDLQETIDAAQADLFAENYDGLQNELSAVARKLQACAKELDDIGVEMKDWSQGLVDFPWTLDGREAFLSWRLGEEKVEFWHEPDDVLGGRQPLSEVLAPHPIHS